MFYRPHFCCHCGEKIVRAKWTPFTSRRFCEFCAVEQKQHDLLPRAATIAAILFGFAGLTAYFGSSGTERTAETRPTVRGVKSESNRASDNRKVQDPKAVAPTEASSPNAAPTANQTSASANTKQRAVEQNSSIEPVSYCGAMTKRGTPCTRRVKTPGRCWQHVGQTGMGSPGN